MRIKLYKGSKVPFTVNLSTVGDVIITSCKYSGSVGSLATYAIELQGSGDLQQVL